MKNKIKKQSIAITLVLLISLTSHAQWNRGKNRGDCPTWPDGTTNLILTQGENTHCVQNGAGTSGSKTYRYDPLIPECSSTLSPTGWTNTDVQVTVGSCTDQPELSGCNPSSYTTQTIKNHDETGQVQASDNATNQATCTESEPSKIDRLPPILSATLQLEHKGLELEATPASSLESEPTKYRAHDGQLDLIFSAEDDPLTTWNSLRSGVSGINEDSIQLTIKRGRDGKELQLPRPTSETSTAPNYRWNINLNKFDDENYPTFAKRGFYTLTLSVADVAGNSVSSPEFYIQVAPANLDDNQSRLLDNCDARNYLANNQEYCEAEMLLRDPYENLIDNRGNITAQIPEQNTAGPYEMVDSPTAHQTLLNGIRFVSGKFSAGKHIRQWESPLPNAKGSFQIRSIAPTIKIIQNSSIPAAKLVEVTPKSVGVQILAPKADKDGSIMDEELTEIVLSTKLLFEPWVKLFLSDNPNNAAPTNPIQFLLGQKQKIYEFATTQFENIALPPNFAVTTFGHTPPNTIFKNLDLSPPEGFELPFITDQKTKEKDIFTHLKSKGGVLEDISVSFTSQISHPVVDPPKDKKHLSYPGGNLGNRVGGTTLFSAKELADALVSDDTPIEGIIVGADIEGQIISESETNFTIQVKGGIDDSRLLRMGGITSKDVREEVTRQAYNLIRGQSPLSENNFNVSNFENDGVSYYKDKTVIIAGGTIDSGTHTIVIEDGNLYITGDIKYKSADNSLGIILINSQATRTPETGNIFIHNSVQHTAGTIFSDGGITSTNVAKNSLPQITTPLDRDGENASNPENLGLQLIHEGTLLTRNTLGGGMLDPLIDPWGRIRGISYEEAERRAQRYDLHFIRRYAPEFNKDGIQTNPEQCVKLPSDKCDPNRHAFVVRPDGRVQNNPPPGFVIY